MSVNATQSSPPAAQSSLPTQGSGQATQGSGRATQSSLQAVQSGQQATQSSPQDLFGALGLDLRWLARLHDRELDSETLGLIRSNGFPDHLALQLEGTGPQAVLDLLRSTLDELGLDPSPSMLDQLAVDYADIYLTHRLRAAPNESVWVDEEELAMQAPMFEIREWMGRHGLTVANWRVRPDDHLVHELEFLAFILEAGPAPDALAEASELLDRHLLRWIPQFSRRVAARCASPFYAGLNALTGHYLDQLRDVLAEIIGVPRPTPEEIQAQIDAERTSRANCGRSEVPVRFAPGVEPSW